MGASRFVKLLTEMGASQFMKLPIVMGASRWVKLLIVTGVARFVKLLIVMVSGKGNRYADALSRTSRRVELAGPPGELRRP